MEATRSRYKEHFSKSKDRNIVHHWLIHNSYIAKFLELARLHLSSTQVARREFKLPDYTTTSIRRIKNAAPDKFRLILVPQRDEVAMRTLSNRSVVARDGLNNAGIEWIDCPLSQGDYMPYDGHPNADGYKNIRLCAESVIKSIALDTRP